MQQLSLFPVYESYSGRAACSRHVARVVGEIAVPPQLPDVDDVRAHAALVHRQFDGGAVRKAQDGLAAAFVQILFHVLSPAVSANRMRILPQPAGQLRKPQRPAAGGRPPASPTTRRRRTRAGPRPARPARRRPAAPPGRPAAGQSSSIPRRQRQDRRRACGASIGSS